MPAYSDIYVLSNNRTTKFINEFLDHFLPAREDSADEYEIPQYSTKPDIVFIESQALLLMCAADTKMEYRIYWRATSDTKPEHAMVFFLEDGYVIYGLSTDEADTEYVTNLFNELKLFLNSSLGYIGFEASPDVENINEFKLQIEAHKP